MMTHSAIKQYTTAFLCLSLAFSFAASAQRLTPDTLWINKDVVVKSGDKADRYIVKDTFLNGQYVMKGFYTNGQIFKDGYAAGKRKEGRGYINGKTTWYNEDGSIRIVQEYREDSAWARNGKGMLVYMADGVHHTDYYDNGQPARRYTEKMNKLMQDEKNRDGGLNKAMTGGLFSSGTGPEIELFYDNGRPALVMDMNKKKWVSYYEDGTKAMELLPKEKGYLLKKYFRNGKPASEETLDDQLVINGPYTYYYSDGVPREKSSKRSRWGDDTYTGPLYEYYPNGKLFKITKYGRGGGASEMVMESPVQDMGSKEEPAKKQPEPERKIPNPDAYTYFDIAGKQTFAYTENDKMPEGVFDYMQKQVNKLLEEKLTAEEKKYPSLNSREVQSTGDRDELNDRYMLDGTLLNGKYIERTGREIRLYSFVDGKPNNIKTYISFEEDYGITRFDISFIGVRFHRDFLLTGNHYDDEEKVFVEENRITRTITESGFLYRLEKKENENRKAPDLYYQLVPQVIRVFHSPVVYLWYDILPSFKIKYKDGDMEKYEKEKQQVEEFIDRRGRHD